MAECIPLRARDTKACVKLPPSPERCTKSHGDNWAGYPYPYRHYQTEEE